MRSDRIRSLARSRQRVKIAARFLALSLSVAAVVASSGGCKRKQFELSCPRPVPLAETIWRDTTLLNGAETMSCVEQDQLIVGREGIPVEKLRPAVSERLVQAGWQKAEQPPSYKGTVLEFFRKGSNLILLDVVKHPQAPNDLVIIRLARAGR